MTDECANCRFWKPDNGWDNPNPADEGTCRRYAPRPGNQMLAFIGEAIIAVAQMLSTQYRIDWPADVEAEATEHTSAVAAPRTLDDYWCGEHEPLRIAGAAP